MVRWMHLKILKIRKMALEPLSGKPENLIGVINQAHTYLIFIMAVEYLYKLYPAQTIIINWGNVSGYNIESVDGAIIAECFVATSYKSNGKLAANLKRLADEISDETGMNRNLAIMYLQVISNMLDGVIYKRAINSKALKKYFDNIWNDYGIEALKTAIQATKLHIKYRRELGYPIDSIEETCNKAEARL